MWSLCATQSGTKFISLLAPSPECEDDKYVPLCGARRDLNLAAKASCLHALDKSLHMKRNILRSTVRDDG